MRDVCAFIVGVDSYDQSGWTVAGPCANAVGIAAWLLGAGADPGNVFLFVEPADEGHDANLASLEADGVHVRRSARSDAINTFWRAELRELSAKLPRLLFFWSGHGFADKNGDRIFICRDYLAPQLITNVFNCTNVLRYLRSPEYQGFKEQICLIDACAIHSDVAIDAHKTPPNGFSDQVNQVTYFATPEGEYAKGDDGRGAFTQVALDVLAKIERWPDLDDLSQKMDEAFKAIDQSIFRVEYYVRDRAVFDRRIGKVSEDAESRFFNLVYPMLCGIEIPDSVYRPHYLRTVSDLGEPELSKAQGLTGMIRELASLNDATGPDEAPYGLLQFLLRLCNEDELARPIGKWLRDHAAEQGNMLATLREKLAKESTLQILVVEVSNDAKGEIESYQLFLRTRDSIPIPGVSNEVRKVSGWEAFRDALGRDIQDLQDGGVIEDYEAHFIVDPPLFDRPFHSIPIPGATTIGEDHIVLLRHRTRIRSAARLQREAWREYAEELRPTRPGDLKVLGVPAEAGTRADLLPRERGLCYMDFVVQPRDGTGSGVSMEKSILLRVLRLGAPYMYWLHKLPDSDALDRIEPEFKRWLEGLDAIDQLPKQFAKERMYGNRLAADATLLWDDPVFNPFRNSRGVSVK